MTCKKIIFFENVIFGFGRDLKEDVVWPRQIIWERTQWVKQKNMGVRVKSQIIAMFDSYFARREVKIFELL